MQVQKKIRKKFRDKLAEKKIPKHLEKLIFESYRDLLLAMEGECEKRFLFVENYLGDIYTCLFSSDLPGTTIFFYGVKTFEREIENDFIEKCKKPFDIVLHAGDIVVGGHTYFTKRQMISTFLGYDSDTDKVTIDYQEVETPVTKRYKGDSKVVRETIYLEKFFQNLVFRICDKNIIETSKFRVKNPYSLEIGESRRKKCIKNAKYVELKKKIPKDPKITFYVEKNVFQNSFILYDIEYDKKICQPAQVTVEYGDLIPMSFFGNVWSFTVFKGFINDSYVMFDFYLDLENLEKLENVKYNVKTKFSTYLRYYVIPTICEIFPNLKFFNIFGKKINNPEIQGFIFDPFEKLEQREKREKPNIQYSLKKKLNDCFLSKGFELDEFKGRGAVATVYRACKKKEKNCDFAIRITDSAIVPEYVDSKLKRNQINQMAKEGLVPKIYDVFQCENKTFEIWELVDGLDFEDYQIEYGNQNEKKIWNMTFEKHKILIEKFGKKHHDLTQRNIMVLFDKKNPYKVLDIKFVDIESIY